MSYKIGLALLLNLLSFTSYSQSGSLQNVYQNQTIYQQGSKYMMGTERYRIGELKPLFEVSPDALHIYTSSLKSYRVGKSISLISPLSLLSIPFVEKRNTRFILLAGGILSNAISIHLTSESIKRISKAIWIRNREVLFGVHT